MNTEFTFGRLGELLALACEDSKSVLRSVCFDMSYHDSAGVLHILADNYNIGRPPFDTEEFYKWRAEAMVKLSEILEKKK